MTQRMRNVLYGRLHSEKGSAIISPSRTDANSIISPAPNPTPNPNRIPNRNMNLNVSLTLS